MITDKIENIDLYSEIPDYAKDFIKKLSSDFEVGRYQLANDDYVNINSYFTIKQSDAKYEKHNKYIDIQLLIKGKEKIYYKDSKSMLNISIPYDGEKDFALYSDNVEGEYIELDGSNFVVLYPHEAHAPQVCAGVTNEQVLKAVVKIKV